MQMSIVQFLPVPGAAFPEVAVFAVVMGEFLDSGLLGDGYGVSCRSAVISYVGHPGVH